MILYHMQIKKHYLAANYSSNQPLNAVTISVFASGGRGAVVGERSSGDSVFLEKNVSPVCAA